MDAIHTPPIAPAIESLAQFPSLADLREQLSQAERRLELADGIDNTARCHREQASARGQIAILREQIADHPVTAIAADLVEAATELLAAGDNIAIDVGPGEEAIVNRLEAAEARVRELLESVGEGRAHG